MDEMRIITLCDTPNPILPEVPRAAILPLTAILSLGAVMLLRRRGAPGSTVNVERTAAETTATSRRWR